MLHGRNGVLVITRSKQNAERKCI